MNKFPTLTEAQRRTVFEQTAANIKLPVASIEKDFWVTDRENARTTNHQPSHLNVVSFFHLHKT